MLVWGDMFDTPSLRFTYVHVKSVRHILNMPAYIICTSILSRLLRDLRIDSVQFNAVVHNEGNRRKNCIEIRYISREKAKVVHVVAKRKKDQGNKMLLIQAYNLFFSGCFDHFIFLVFQLCGSTITFIIPLMLMALTVKLGFPTSNANVHSV